MIEIIFHEYDSFSSFNQPHYLRIGIPRGLH